MKTTIITVCSTILLTAVGVATGCDAPNEPAERAELVEDADLLLELLESEDPESVVYALETLGAAGRQDGAEPGAPFEPAGDLQVSEPMQSSTCEDIVVYGDPVVEYWSDGTPLCFYAATGVGPGCQAACADWAAAEGYAGEQSYFVSGGTSYCIWVC